MSDQKLKLTDVPNVAQVIRLARGVVYEDRLHRRLRRWWRQTLAQLRGENPATHVQAQGIVDASERRRMIDASGQVVGIPTARGGSLHADE